MRFSLLSQTVNWPFSRFFDSEIICLIFIVLIRKSSLIILILSSGFFLDETAHQKYFLFESLIQNRSHNLSIRLFLFLERLLDDSYEENKNMSFLQFRRRFGG